MAGMTEDAPPAPSRSVSPDLAAFLSFILPGLGQTSTGRLRRGILFAIPIVAVPLLALAMLLRGRVEMVALLVRPGVLEALLVLNVALAAWHLLAIVDAQRLARRRNAGR